MKRYYKYLGFVILILIIWKIDFHRLTQIMGTLEIDILIVVLLLNLPVLFIKSLRWRYILKLQSISYSLSQTFISYLSGLFVGIVTPGRLGEAIKIFYLKEDQGIPLSKGLSGVLADRLFDLCFLILFGILGIWYLRIFGQLNQLTMIFIFLAIVAIFIYLISKNRFKDFIVSFFGQKFDGLIISLEQFLTGFKDLARPKIILPGFLTVLSYIVYFIQCHLILLSLSIKIDFLMTVFLMSLINLASLVPISILGIGTREAAMIYLFALINIPKEEAIAFSSVIFAVFYVFGGFFGYGGWILRNKISLAKVDNE
ncbi:MAG: flippase-like domain-containing protein [Desulfobacterales bacterium]|nr:flippase-like domain-containing protein [Desulfobacterales bacterium]